MALLNQMFIFKAHLFSWYKYSTTTYFKLLIWYQWMGELWKLSSTFWAFPPYKVQQNRQSTKHTKRYKTTERNLRKLYRENWEVSHECFMLKELQIHHKCTSLPFVMTVERQVPHIPENLTGCVYNPDAADLEPLLLLFALSALNSFPMHFAWIPAFYAPLQIRPAR